MQWFNWLGVGLEVVGLLGAMYLLARLKETVTGRQVMVLRWVRVGWSHVLAFVRRLLRRRPAPITINLEPATLRLEASPLGVTRSYPLMPDGLTVEARVAWLYDFVRDLESRHNDLTVEVVRQASVQRDAVQAVRADAQKEIRQAVDEARVEVRKLVGQDVGWEIWWLAVVVAGVVLSAL
jgi:hypothetical protein